MHVYHALFTTINNVDGATAILRLILLTSERRA